MSQEHDMSSLERAPHLILSPRLVDDIAHLAQVAGDRGWTVERLQGWRPSGAVLPERVALYGEPLFARVVAAQIGRALLEPPLDWLTRLPQSILGRRIDMVPLRDLKTLDYPLFLKPPDDKLFAAAVYASPASIVERGDLEPDQPVLVSEPVRFMSEFRVHVLRGRAVSCSRYCVDGALSESATDPDREQAAQLAEQAALLAQAWTPPAVVIDVGRLESGQWAVVEANPCFGAGIYAGDAAGVLDVLLEACRPLAERQGPLGRFMFPVELG